MSKQHMTHHLNVPISKYTQLQGFHMYLISTCWLHLLYVVYIAGCQNLGENRVRSISRNRVFQVHLSQEQPTSHQSGTQLVKSGTQADAS